MRKNREDYSEEELVAGCVRNDRYSQELFYRRFAPGMLRMCLRYTSDREEAMDIVNTGMLRVFQKIDTYAFKGSLEGWVRRLVFHALADHFRKGDRKVQFLSLEDRDRPDPAAALHNLYIEDIFQLVDKLPEASREVFWLYAVEGYSHAEIGERLGISEGTSKWHLSTARQKLRNLLEKQYFKRNNYAG